MWWFTLSTRVEEFLWVTSCSLVVQGTGLMPLVVMIKAHVLSANPVTSSTPVVRQNATEALGSVSTDNKPANHVIVARHNAYEAFGSNSAVNHQQAHSGVTSSSY